jgi:molecular chaperone GrpE
MSKKENGKGEQEEIKKEDDQAGSSAESAAASNPEAVHLEEVEQDAIEALQLALKSAQEEAAANLDGWQRAQADFMNYKKRIEREQVQTRQDAAMRVIRRFLEVVDDLDRAMANQPADSAGTEWMAGVDLVYRKLMNILDSEGVTVMEVAGQQFDPNLHEAISLEPSPDHVSGQIIEVLQKGYMIGDRVLRPAQVRIAS